MNSCLMPQLVDSRPGKYIGAIPALSRGLHGHHGGTGILQAMTGWIGHSGRLRSWLSGGASDLASRAILADPKLE